MSREQKIEELITQCRGSSIPIQCAAISDLQEMGAKEALPVFIDLLDSPAVDVRANAVYSIGEMADTEVGAHVMNLLYDSDALVRVNTIEALGMLGYIDGLPRIIQVLKSDIDPLVRLQAAETLGVLGDENALSALIDALSDSHDHVRAYAADSIGRLQAKEALPVLQRKLVMEQSRFTKAFILSAMYRLGYEKALTPLFDLAGIADDTLSVTILNLIADFAVVRDVSKIKEKISDISQSRPELVFEMQSLLKRIDTVSDAK